MYVVDDYEGTSVDGSATLTDRFLYPFNDLLTFDDFSLVLLDRYLV